MSRYEASAPARCGIVGNPSDLYGGVVVSCSVPLRARCRIASGPAAVSGGDARLWEAVQRRFPLRAEAQVEWSSEIPRSSGLAGSTALITAMLACALAERGESDRLSDRGLLSELVRDVERNEAGVVCGYQDAVMAVHGGLQRMDFAGKSPCDPGPPAAVAALESELPFLLVNTGIERLSGAVHGPLMHRWLAGETKVVEAMDRIAALGRAGADALAGGDWTGLAEAMNENHALVADIGGSGEAVDVLIARCLSCGARAAKLAGAGLGGTIIALTHEPDDLQKRLEALGYERFARPAPVPGVILKETP
jgi:galactokinase/mevalonate kinase-like predicted kinase